MLVLLLLGGVSATCPLTSITCVLKSGASVTIADGDGDCFFPHDNSNSCVIAGGPADCDDANKLVSPSSTNSFCNCVFPPAATESCDGFDNNCNNQTDEGLWFDADGDGFSAILPTSAYECIAGRLGGSTSHFNNDCNDTDATIFPGAHEIPCDDILQNCTLGADLAADFADNDGDGFFVPTVTLTPDQVAECMANNIHFPDCNDNSASAHNGLQETDAPFRVRHGDAAHGFTFGDGLDNDCNDHVDDVIKDAVEFTLTGQILSLDRARKRMVYAAESALDSSDETCTNVVIELQLTNIAAANDATNVIIQGKVLLSHGAKVAATVLGQLGQYGFKVDGKTGAITWVQFKLPKFDPAGVLNVQKVHVPICAHDANAPIGVHLSVVRSDQLDFDLAPASLSLSQ